MKALCHPRPGRPATHGIHLKVHPGLTRAEYDAMAQTARDVGIRSGTTNAGAYFAEQDTFGRVAPGHRADLLLVEANPLEDVAHLTRLAGVMAHGRWLPRAEIDARLAEIAAQYAR